MRLRGVSDLEVDLPNLQSSVPTDRGEVGVEGALGLGLQLGRISHLRHPVLMVVSLRSVLQSAKVFQSLISLSAPEEMI